MVNASRKQLDDLIESALRHRASDIHFRRLQNASLSVSFRIDGKLKPVTTLSPGFADKLLIQLRAVAGVDVADNGRIADAHFRYACETARAEVCVDVRLALLPAQFGQNIVMRLLPNTVLALDALGMTPQLVREAERMLNRQSGLILLTGATGSGKTTTAHAMLRKILSWGAVSVVTIENPIEYTLEGEITQLQVCPALGYTFPVLFRHALRADPDVVFIGEIRDKESAQLCIESAGTGHNVIATLHAERCAQAPARLRDLGIREEQLSSVLTGVYHQRLARTLCPKCAVKTPDGVSAAGCPECGYTGERGRIGVFEALRMGSAPKHYKLEDNLNWHIAHGLISKKEAQRIDDGRIF